MCAVMRQEADQAKHSLKPLDASCDLAAGPAPTGAKALSEGRKRGDVEPRLGREMGDQQLLPAFLTQFWRWAQG